jgi:hypothetical protein
MKELLDYLERRAQTLTIYDFAGSDQQRQEIASWLAGHGVNVQIVDTDSDGPGNVAVLHHEGEILDACSAESLLARTSVEDVFAASELPQPDILSSLSTDVAVKPALSIKEMVRVSRDFERRALREGGGELHAGFQQLSQLVKSTRTMEMYTTLANEGVDVRVYGYPNTTIEDVPFTVVEDPDRQLERHWFLLYDGGGNPNRKATLVSEERPVDGELTGSTTAEDEEPVEPTTDAEPLAGVYDSFFTTNPTVVDDLFELARAEHATLFAADG